MVREIIKEVEKAEKEAARIIEDARKQAQEILLRIAEEKEILGKQILEKALKEAEKKRIQALSLARKKEDIFMEELESRIKGIEQLFESKRDEITEILLKNLSAWL